MVDRRTHTIGDSAVALTITRSVTRDVCVLLFLTEDSVWDGTYDDFDGKG